MTFFNNNWEFIIIGLVIGLIIVLFFVKKHKNRPRALQLYQPPEEDDIQKKNADYHEEKLKQIRKQIEEQIAKSAEDKELDKYQLFSPETSISGIVKPVGKWTAAYLREKIPMILAFLRRKKQENKKNVGHWQTHIEITKNVQGKHKGKGR